MSTIQHWLAYRKIPICSPVICLSLMLLVALVPSAFAEPVGSGAMMAHNSGKCIAVSGSSLADAADAVQTNCNGDPNQKFSLIPVGNNYYNIKVEHSGKCLNVFGGETENLARIIQWPCSNGSTDNDSFQLETIGTGYRVVARHSGRCLNVEGGTSANDARIIQYDCEGNNNEIFTIGAMGNSNGGIWSAPIKLPLVPAAAGIMSTGEVLGWSAYGRMTFGGDQGFTQTFVYDPDTGSITEKRVSNTQHDMFCPGTAVMADGRIMVTGGSSAGKVSIYEPLLGQWTAAPEMNRARAYHSSASLADGSVIVVGGSWAGGIGDKGAEVFRDNQWTQLTGVSTLPLVGDDPAGLYRSDNHMWLFPWTGNRVFHAGPSRAMHMISTEGHGSTTVVGNRGSDSYAMNGSAVMYAPGKILTTGGAAAYENRLATTNAHIIDLSGSSVTSQTVSPMQYRRAFHHSVVLPNGEVMVVGGEEYPIPFDDQRSILTPELFNPQTGSFTALAPMAIPRTYHSFALLMHDARVFVGGGGLCGNCQTNHADAEIFTPPYLLDTNGQPVSNRPVITQAARNLAYGGSAVVRTNSPVNDFVLVRLASSTHSVNTDQRRIPLAFSNSGNLAYSLSLPTDPGIAPPGEYMLFALNAAGVPSVAKVVKLTLTAALDTDGDGIPDSTDSDDDNDGVDDAEDAFPLDANESVDTDSDGIGNNADTDDDGDGFDDTNDVFPLDPTEWRDSDGDGIGDNADPDTGGGACNLLENGSLDNNTDGWATNTTLSIVTDAQAGNGAMTWADGWASTVFVAAANTSYSLTGFAKSPVGSGWAGLGIDFLDSDSVELSEVVLTVRPVGNYANINLGDLSPAGTAYARLWIYTSSTRSIFVDELDIRAEGCIDGGGNVNQAPEVINPGTQTDAVGNTVSLQIVATDAEAMPLQYSASNLPVGLQIHSDTGVISGEPTAEGQSAASVEVTDGVTPRSVSFNWNIVPAGSGTDACNLLANGDFEEDDSGWYTTSDRQLTTNASQGNQALQINAGSISALASVSPGTSYTVSGKYLLATTSGWSGFGVDYLDAAGDEISEEVVSLQPRSAYGDMTLNGAVPAGTSEIRLWIYTSSGRPLTLDALQLRDSSCGV